MPPILDRRGAKFKARHLADPAGGGGGAIIKGTPPPSGAGGVQKKRHRTLETEGPLVPRVQGSKKFTSWQLQITNELGVLQVDLVGFYFTNWIFITRELSKDFF